MRTDRFRQLILAATSPLLGLCLSALVLIECAEIVLRYGFSTTLHWAADVSGLLLLLLGWLGAGHLWIAKQHLVVDLFPGNFPMFFRIVSTVGDIAVLVGVVWLTPKILGAMAIYSEMIMPSLTVSASVKFIPMAIGLLLIALGSALNLLEQETNFPKQWPG